jgi:hypothetical protein
VVRDGTHHFEASPPDQFRVSTPIPTDQAQVDAAGVARGRSQCWWVGDELRPQTVELREPFRVAADVGVSAPPALERPR